ncbi:hypothetical protein ABG79_02119 [Caloramator mitchellensis]|uniref:Uncharacterized protein n=1 Tax=Caloramator mitchellensis TaxID=908809 RepID=A0A0R3JZQ5_CALMK|nr:hypothetical protein [Caloramator mitchellensis]KRQ86085.1 hypothetical protein ABG79_02119 [Caloramator mitchellensis]
MEIRNKKDGKRYKFNFNLEHFGEFVPSFFKWILPQEQRERIREINNRLKQ